MTAGPDPAPNVFAGLSLVLDRAAERRDDIEWANALEHSPSTRFLPLDDNGEAWLADDGSLHWLTDAERRALAPDAPASLLGLLGGDRRGNFLLRIDHKNQAAALDVALGKTRANLRRAAMQLSPVEAGMFAYAKGLAHWQRETRFCSHCGHPLELAAFGHRGKCTHEACARLHFPRTDAAIIVIVEEGDACLLGRQHNWPKGRFSTLAGFVEPGESLEDAVRREVAEESGVIVKDVSYHSSQPWPMPASLMVGFTATAASRAIDLRDGELEEARWFTAAQIADGIADGSFLPSPPISVSYHLLAQWLRTNAGMDLDALVAAAAR